MTLKMNALLVRAVVCFINHLSSLLHCERNLTWVLHMWHLKEAKSGISFKWGRTEACLFMTNCVALDAAALCVFSHAQYMHYVFVVLSGFLCVECWHLKQNDLSKKVICSTVELLGEVCKSNDLSWCDDSRVKSGKVPMSVNFQLAEQVSASRHGHCPTSPPRFLNHTCHIENKWVSGGWMACGSKWILLSMCSGGCTGFVLGMMYERSPSWRGDYAG